jgi:mRNA interferase RelE/StbE
VTTIWQVRQTRRFARQYKKLQDNVAADVDDAIALVQSAPNTGVLKKGDLATLRVHKFRSCGQLYLLGYSLDETICLIYLEAVGPHENFYRDMKRQ